MARSQQISLALILVCCVLGCGGNDDPPPPDIGTDLPVDHPATSEVEPKTAEPPSEEPPTEPTTASTTATIVSDESKTVDRPEWTLIEAIRQSPWDEAVILKLADWYAEHDPPRAELVRVQLELSPLKYNDPRRKELQVRENELLNEHRERWTAALKPLGDSGDADFDVGLIESIDIDGATDERLVCVLHVPEVRELRLENSRLTADGYELVAGLPQLDSLTISGESISSADIDRLDELPPRTDIRLYFEDIDQDAVERVNARRVAKFDTLSPEEQFSTGVRFASAFDSGLTYGRMMDGFNLSQSGMTDEKLRLLSRLTHLQGLSIDETNVTSEGMAVFGQMTELKRLSIGGTYIESISRLSGLTKLESLFIYPYFGKTMGDSGLAAIENFTAMRDLYLSDDEASDATVRRLAGMTKLEELDLHINDLTDESCLEALAGMTELRRLSVYTGNVTDAALRNVAGMKKLEQLDMGIDRGTGAGLQHLSGLTNLRRLGLSGDGVTDAGLEHLAGLSNLTAFVAQGSKITPGGAAALAAKLSHVTILLDEHVVKSPRDSWTLMRCRVGNQSSVLLPIDWFEPNVPTSDDEGVYLTEDGWRLIGSYSGDNGPAQLALSRGYGIYDEAESAQEAMKMTLEEASEVKVLKRDLIELTGVAAASCIYREEDNGTRLLVIAKTKAGGVALECSVNSGRFIEFQDLFLAIARSLRVSADPAQHAETTVVIPVSELNPPAK